MLVVYDGYIPKEYFEKAFAEVAKTNNIRFTELEGFGTWTPRVNPR